MKIRSATISDIPAILALERETPAAAHWAEHQYLDLFKDEAQNSRHLLLVIEDGSTVKATPIVLGFLVAHSVDGEWELENIALSPNARREGLATKLMQQLFRLARESHGESVFLEVRESNHPASAFYEKLGFVQSGRRRSYYPNPPEDAILYRRVL